jgi:hypothetical protein
MWKGAAETLNSNPTAVAAMARKTSGSHGSRDSTAAAISRSFVEPEMP